MDINNINKELFREKGYCFVKGLLSDDEVHRYKDMLQRYTQINDQDYRTKKSWNEADGVSKNPQFWPLLYHEKLLSVLSKITVGEPKYLQHSDIQVNLGEVGWHRDSAHGAINNGEVSEDVGALRVAIYLQSFTESKFQMGIVPGTHRHTSWIHLLENSLWSFYHKLTKKLPPFYITLRPKWFEIDAGDCLIFDTRILHSGTKPWGPKYSIYLVYGENGNSLCKSHYHYIHHIRKDLGYEKCPGSLVELLKEKELLYELTEE